MRTTGPQIAMLVTVAVFAGAASFTQVKDSCATFDIEAIEEPVFEEAVEDAMAPRIPPFAARAGM